ncbi:trehalose-6-phosphate synthase, partial [Rhizobium johnstonii]
MIRLVVVSNRGPMPAKDWSAAAGGLAFALQAALQERGGMWMGWSGESSGDGEPGALSQLQKGSVTYALNDLTDT